MTNNRGKGRGSQQQRDILSREDVSRIAEEVRLSRHPTQADEVLSNLKRISGSLRNFGYGRERPIPSILGHVGNYWRSGIMSLLRPMPLRPSVMKRQFAALVPDHPISHRILTLNLRLLERDGMIRRYAVAGSRAHVEYELTEMGREVCQLMWSVIDWGEENFDQIAEARKKFDQAS